MRVGYVTYTREPELHDPIAVVAFSGWNDAAGAATNAARWVARRLGLHAPEPPAPPAVLAVESRMPLRGELLSFYIDEAVAVAGVALEELEFPEGAAVALIVRGDALIPAKGSTVLQPGPVHGGVTEDPARQLEHLRERLVG